MKNDISKQITKRTFCLMLLACLAAIGLSQTSSQTPYVPPADARGVIKLRVRAPTGVGNKTTGVSRKRFFMFKGSLEENKPLLQNIEQRPVVSRDCYYRSRGASEGLITWLKQSDCESVYCREVEQKDIEGPGAVREFQDAILLGEKEFGNRELARKWLSVNLKEDLRDGFYKQQQRDIQTTLKQAEELSRSKVLSVMTDTNGTAFFTDIEPGTYVISNILPTEVGSNATIWSCEITLKPDEVASEKPFLIPNPANKKMKCVNVEKRPPECPAPPK